MKICLDPGHQRVPDLRPENVGPSSKVTKARCAAGTRGARSGIPEHVVVLDYATRLAELLRERDFTVVMTRTSQDVRLSNRERAAFANRAGVDLCLRIHCNGVRWRWRHLTGRLRRGTSVLAPGGTMVGQEVRTASRQAAEIVHDYLVGATGFPDGGVVEREDLTGFNWSTVPVVLIELGYLTHPAEEQALLRPDVRERVAASLCSALVELRATWGLA